MLPSVLPLLILRGEGWGEFHEKGGRFWSMTALSADFFVVILLIRTFLSSFKYGTWYFICHISEVMS